MSIVAYFRRRGLGADAGRDAVVVMLFWAVRATFATTEYHFDDGLPDNRHGVKVYQFTPVTTPPCHQPNSTRKHKHEHIAHAAKERERDAAKTITALFTFRCP